MVTGKINQGDLYPGQLGKGQPGRCHCSLPDGLEGRQPLRREASACLLLMLHSALFNLLQEKAAQFPLLAASKLHSRERAAMPGQPLPAALVGVKAAGSHQSTKIKKPWAEGASFGGKDTVAPGRCQCVLYALMKHFLSG